MSAKLVDFSFSRPAVAEDVVAVVRYGVGGDSAKHLTVSEVNKLHSEGKSIVLAFESTAQRSREGTAAGKADVDAMEKWARSIGYPKQCPIFYAVDFDATPSEVSDYFHGVIPGAYYPSGPYAGITVVDAVLKAHPNGVAWQTLAWSAGKISKNKRCVLYQSDIGNGYDDDRTLQPFQAWSGTNASKEIGGKPAPKPKPTKLEGLSIVSRAATTHLTKYLPKRKRGPSASARARLEATQKAINEALKK